jgi:GTP-binding protein Era
LSAPGYRCGYIALVGRPNVGKSTLLNRLLGQKISITSKRPQTTRHRILGIKTLSTAQFVYVDTPGLHHYEGRAMNRHMNREATRALQQVDIVVFMVEGLRWTRDDELVLEELASVKCPVLLVVNKVDLITDKPSLLPGLQALSGKRDFEQIIPLSASSGQNVAERALPGCRTGSGKAVSQAWQGIALRHYRGNRAFPPRAEYHSHPRADLG